MVLFVYKYLLRAHLSRKSHVNAPTPGPCFKPSAASFILSNIPASFDGLFGSGFSPEVSGLKTNTFPFLNTTA